MLAPEFLPIWGGVGTHVVELVRHLPRNMEVSSRISVIVQVTLDTCLTRGYSILYHAYHYWCATAHATKGGFMWAASSSGA
jgi:hypothetical protein